jgi:hypothetical protein
MALTSQALSQYAKDQVALVQQIVATGEVVTRLTAERNRGGDLEGSVLCGGVHNGPPPGGAQPHTIRLTFGRTKTDEDILLHSSALPKMSFPKFSGEHPRIWIDKCADYFRIFNIRRRWRGDGEVARRREKRTEAAALALS